MATDQASATDQDQSQSGAPLPQRPSVRVRRRRAAIAVAGLTTAAALSTGAASPGPAGAAPKNSIPSYTTVQHGCTNQGFRLSTTSPEGFLLAYGTHGGACSISGPWGVPVLHGAQGRLTYTPPSGSRIALWNLHIEAVGQGSPPVSTEIYANDPGGEYQVHNFSTGTYNGPVNTSANHPDGAHSMFFLMRSHQQHTQNSGWYRHANIGSGRVDLYDLTRPTLSGVSVDGGSSWSSNPTRAVRWTGGDNLGNRGIERYTVRAGSSVLYDSGAGGGTTGAKSRSINIGSLPDGTHPVTVTAESAGSGDLGDTVSAAQTVRIDRTAPTLSSLSPLPSSVSGDLTISLSATDAHSGIKDVTIERAVPGGWEAVHTAASNFGAIPVNSLVLTDGEEQLRAVAADVAGNTQSILLGSVSIRNAPRRSGTPRALVELPAEIKPGRVLRAAPGTWSGVAPITFSYQWQRGDSGAWSDVAGATDGSYTIAGADIGKRLRLRLNVDNPAPGSVTELSDVSEPVQPLATGGQLPPVISGNARVPPPPTTGPQPQKGARLVLDSPTELEAANAKRRGVALRARRTIPIFLVRYPKPSRVSIGGRFVQADGTPIPGHPVALVEAGVVRDWARTDGAGRVSFTYRPLRSGALRLRWGGNNSHDPILATAAMKVIGRLGAKAQKNARGGRALVVRGRTVPGVRSELLILERLNTTRCAAWRHVVVNGRTLSAARRTARQAGSAPARCWDAAGKARTRARGVFTMRERRLPSLRLANGARPRSWSYATYLRVRGLNTISNPVRVTVRG